MTGSSIAVVAGQPTRMMSCGCSGTRSTSCWISRRVASTSSAWLSGVAASPSTVAASSTALVASGVQPVERVVVCGGDHEQHGRVVVRPVLRSVVRLVELSAREAAQRQGFRVIDPVTHDADGGYAVAAGRVAVGPLAQFGCVAGSDLLVACGIGEGRGEPRAHRRVGHREQQRTGAPRLVGEFLEMAVRHRPVAHPPPIGVPPVDRRELGRIAGVV